MEYIVWKLIQIYMWILVIGASIKSHFLSIRHLKYTSILWNIIYWSSQCTIVFISGHNDRRYASVIVTGTYSSSFCEWSILTSRKPKSKRQWHVPHWSFVPQIGIWVKSEHISSDWLTHLCPGDIKINRRSLWFERVCAACFRQFWPVEESPALRCAWRQSNHNGISTTVRGNVSDR